MKEAENWRGNESVNLIIIDELFLDILNVPWLDWLGWIYLHKMVSVPIIMVIKVITTLSVHSLSLSGPLVIFRAELLE